MKPREESARRRMEYWHRRLEGARDGTDSTDPDFVYLATRMYNLWVYEVTKMELERRRAA